MTRRDSTKAPAPTGGEPKRRAKAGVVRVALPTIILSEETAQALAFKDGGMVSADWRVNAAAVRKTVTEACAQAVDELLVPARAALEIHNAQVEIAAAEAEAARAVAALEALRAKAGTGGEAAEP
jgi:ribosomal protein L15E